ncbi:hypothetical protein [Streptomyces violaceusniger]|uniref:NIPSNAP domain-containing protein n=1 Tax=Streptomyces violaceusniger TaxID=68280 RepID=A0A4D4KS56_STRVO|nr:hypothetical protein SVIO_003390 [Streptomyces violaceusniger]
MAEYMLAQLRLRYGFATLERYNATMPLVRDLFESQGIRLRHGVVTRVGPLFEAWNLWEIEDQGHVARAFAALASSPSPEFETVAQALDEIVVSEDVRYLESLPFSPV